MARCDLVRRTKLITIQKMKPNPTEVRNKPDKSSDVNWVTHTKAYANVVTGNSREYYVASQVHADLSHLWDMRSTTLLRSVTPKMRIKWDDRTFNIIAAVDENEANNRVIISTKEVV